MKIARIIANMWLIGGLLFGLAMTWTSYNADKVETAAIGFAHGYDPGAGAWAHTKNAATSYDRGKQVIRDHHAARELERKHELYKDGGWGASAVQAGQGVQGGQDDGW